MGLDLLWRAGVAANKVVLGLAWVNENRLTQKRLILLVRPIIHFGGPFL